MSTLEGKTLFITGARGVGFEIGLMAARQGANVVIAAKTIEPDQLSSQTIYTAAEAIEREGGQALPIQMDLRYEDNIINAVDMAVESFGGLDICINSASAVQVSNFAHIDMKRYDLMQQINVRGAFMCARTALPYLKESKNPHILTITPPLNIKTCTFKPHLPYSLSKFSTSLLVMALSESLKEDGIAVNALWNKAMLSSGEVTAEEDSQVIKQCMHTSIMADAAKYILEKSASKNTGKFYIDQEVLEKEGKCKDFSKYCIDADSEVMLDVFMGSAETA